MSSILKNRIIFYMTPAYGHIFSVITVVEKLCNEGYDVTCVATEPFRKYIEQSGAGYLEYEKDFSNLLLNEATSNLFALYKTLIEYNNEIYEKYIGFTEEFAPDLIMYDSMCSFAKNIASKLQIKSVCMVSTIAFNLPVCMTSTIGISSVPLFLKNAGKFSRLLIDEKKYRKRNGLPKFRLIDLFMNSGDLTLVMTPEKFQPCRKTFPKSVRFVGSTIKEQIRFFHGDEEYKDYDWFLSMGTVMTDKVDRLENFLIDEEFSMDRIIVLVGKSDVLLNKYDEKPNIDIKKWVNQLDLMPHVRRYINQAGLGSVYGAMYFGVPQICIPSQEEQKCVARIARKNHCGIYLKKYDVDAIKKAYRKMDKLDLHTARDIIRAVDGTQNSYDIITDYLKEI